MTPYDDALYQLQKQVARAAQLRTLIPELRQRHTQMSSHVKDLHRSMRREQRDVDKLEGKTFTALYHYATGTMGSQLDKERKEACSVREAYDLAAAQLRDLEAELERSEAELADLEGCEARFQTLLSEKLKFLKARGGEAAENIQTLEARIHKLDLQKKEIRDAIVAGRAALRAANQIERYLDDGRRQSIGDIVSTGILSEVLFWETQCCGRSKILYWRIPFQTCRIPGKTGKDLCHHLHQDQHQGFSAFRGFLFQQNVRCARFPPKTELCTRRNQSCHRCNYANHSQIGRTGSQAG